MLEIDLANNFRSRYNIDALELRSIMSKEIISGIYAIVNKTNNKRYIGSSKSVRHRWNQSHRPLLRNNSHPNNHLQNSWNKYGEYNFVFEIIEECEESILADREGYWIEHHKSWNRSNGYNLVRYIEGRNVVSEDTKQKMRDAWEERLKQYYTTGVNKEILDLFHRGMSKNAITIQLGITRSTVYSCLEHNGLHENTGRGSEIKLTEEVKKQVRELRDQNKTVTEIIETTGISETQLRRTETIVGDNRYGGTKVKRETYRTVTSDIIEKVKSLREQGLKWEDIEKEVGVSRFALHQNGVTEKFKNPSAHKTKKNKVSQEVKDKIDAMLNEEMSIKHISEVTGVAQSTIRWRKDKNVNQPTC